MPVARRVMTIVYWILAIAISLVMGAVTSVVVAFILRLTLTRDLTPETQRVWDLFVAAVTFATYLVVSVSTEPSALVGGAQASWAQVWSSLEYLLHVEVTWLFRIAGFWAVITIIIHLVPYRRM
jgi:hypothetical protein